MRPLSNGGDVLASGTWAQDQGYVLAGNGTTYEANALLEPEVLLPDPSAVGAQMRMWYNGGWNTSALNTATSNDGGVTWTRYANNPVVGQGHGGETGPCAHAGIVRAPDGTIHCFYAATVDMTVVPLYAVSSTDGGLTFGNRRTILTKQGWEKGVWGNSAVVIDNGTWHLLYESYDLNNIWKVGYATSPDGITWTRQNGGNPISTLQIGTGSFGGCNLIRRPAGDPYKWELFYHASTSGTLPTSIYRAVSNDLINWELRPGGTIVTRSQSFEVDQVADPCVVTIGGQRVMFFEGVDNPNAIAKIARAVYHPPA